LSAQHPRAGIDARQRRFAARGPVAVRTARGGAARRETQGAGSGWQGQSAATLEDATQVRRARRAMRARGKCSTNTPNTGAKNGAQQGSGAPRALGMMVPLYSFSRRPAATDACQLL